MPESFVVQNTEINSLLTEPRGCGCEKFASNFKVKEYSINFLAPGPAGPGGRAGPT